MTDVKAPAPVAKAAAQETKAAAQKMAPAAVINPDTPAPFSDPDANKVEAPILPPISQRLEKLERLNVLIAQRDEVTEALENLQKFDQSPNGGQSVIFRAANGTSTQTHNPVAIAAMVAQGVTMLKAKLSDIESQIIF